MKMKLVTSMIFVMLLANMLTITFNLVPSSVATEDVSYEVLDEVGTHFELQQFNIFITTDTKVHIRLFASSEMLSYLIENTSMATFTQLTLGTLKSLTTYYMYEDSYVNENVFTTDDVGSYTYTQDLSQIHQVFIQPRSSTIFISESTTLHSDIYETVVIIADNIVLDLNGYSIIGGGWPTPFGVDVSYRNNVTIKNGGISNFYAGINLWGSKDVIISNNTITSNVGGGIRARGKDVVISNNTIASNGAFGGGIELCSARFFVITDNNFISNGGGIVIGWGSSYNIIYHNNFIDNGVRDLGSNWNNMWDDGYPSGGNYWSYYTGVDLYNGPGQDILGSDGIGDTPYTISSENIDHYPLMNSWTPVETNVNIFGEDFPVRIISNTTIAEVYATENWLMFMSSGSTGETGYVNVIFPMVNTTEIVVLVDFERLTPPPFPVINTNGTHYFIYFEFVLSTHTVIVQFAPITATVDIDPDTLNLKSNGEFVTTYMQLPEGYDVANIVLETVQMDGIQAVTDTQYGFVTDPDSYLLDLDGDGIAETRMVKFDRATVRDIFTTMMDYEEGVKFYDLTLTVAGEFVDGTLFEGTDTIMVIKK